MKKIVLGAFVCFFASAFFYGLAEGMFPEAGQIVPILVAAPGAVLSTVWVLRAIGRGRARSITRKPEYQAEGLELDSQAGRLTSRHWCPGRLFLTKQRVVFDSVTGDLHHAELQLTDIAAVHTHNKLFNRSLEILDKSGNKLRFSLPERDRAMWAVAIERAIEQAKPGSTSMADELSPVEQANAATTESNAIETGTSNDETLPA